MDRGVRIAAAASVLLGGILVAMLFRHPASHGSAGGEHDERLVLRQGAELSTAADARSGRVNTAGTFTAGPAGCPPTVVKPRSVNEHPPELARDFPGASAPVPADWNPAVGNKIGDGGTGQPAEQTHKIVDGDTLPALAQRYLGSADRAAEIYDLNRTVLPRPEVLPIGVQLKLPPRQSARPTPPNYMPQRPVSSGQ